MKKQFLTIFTFLGLSVMLISWGGAGHYKISYASGLSFNSQMVQFNPWVSVLADHASDADDRKSWDPNEGPKHYIDIDNYNEFLTGGRIPQTLDSAIAIHGAAFVYDQGILPWATITAYDSLKSCFGRLDWANAVLFASDLGHYVADGYMPLHITRNYNGQYSGNNGIHSRFESTMINAYVSQITYPGFDIAEIENVNQYIFDYLYVNYTYVDSVIGADDYAKAIAGNTNSSAYKQALWNKSKGFTTLLFKNASHTLTQLIFTAWVQAGSPQMEASAITPVDPESSFFLGQNVPNPFKNATTVNYKIPKNSEVLLQVFDLSGKHIATLAEGQKAAGNYSIGWNPEYLKPGIYYLTLKSREIFEVKKMVVLN